MPSSHKQDSHNPNLPIGDYAIIGDLHTVALVGKNGSINWCCIPRFDSPSVFGALLDTQKGGFFRICPVEDHQQITQKQLYMPGTNILITRFLTVDGIGEVIDFMPINHRGTVDYKHAIIRSVNVVSGSLSFAVSCRPAFNYARDSHKLTLSDKGAVFHSESCSLGLASPVPLEDDGKGGVHATFTLHENQTMRFVLESAKEHAHNPQHHTEQQYQAALQETINYWHQWLSQCQYKGRWREMVQRSALALKLMIYAPTGAIVAAPTTSLPEALGGDRNWDYRYTWLRDASFTIDSLLLLGFTGEATAFMGWMEDRCHELEADGSLQPMYTIDGGHDLKEIVLDHLTGYDNSKPVRIGNGAYTQEQLDVYGELMDGIYLYNQHRPISYKLWQNICQLLGWLLTNWQLPDSGFWEVRGDPKHYVDSRVMSWVAFDRALRIARSLGFPAPVEEWTKTSAEIYRQVMEKGWNEQKRTFVQAYNTDALDASTLLLIPFKFVSPTDELALSTIERIKSDLSSGTLIHRYSAKEAEEDGLGRAEGTFSACGFWMVMALARAGRVDEARMRLEMMLSFSNEVGLYSEKLSPTGQALGNFPQALTHLALIRACYDVDLALDSKYHHP